MSVAIARSLELPEDAKAFAAFQRLVEDWRLTPQESCALLELNPRTFYRWRAASDRVHLSRDQRTRISYLVNMYLDSHAVLGEDSSTADEWIRRGKAAFSGASPLEVLIAGTLVDFHNVYHYLRRVAGS
jgi:hypothetical protein